MDGGTDKPSYRDARTHLKIIHMNYKLRLSLIQFYDATVLDMNSVLRPAIESELQQQNDELRATLLQDAVIQVGRVMISRDAPPSRRSFAI